MPTDYRDYKIQVFEGINDTPVEPTSVQAGNGSHLISQFNTVVTKLFIDFNYISENLDNLNTITNGIDANLQLAQDGWLSLENSWQEFHTRISNLENNSDSTLPEGLITIYDGALTIEYSGDFRIGSNVTYFDFIGSQLYARSNSQLGQLNLEIPLKIREIKDENDNKMTGCNLFEAVNNWQVSIGGIEFLLNNNPNQCGHLTDSQERPFSFDTPIKVRQLLDETGVQLLTYQQAAIADIGNAPTLTTVIDKIHEILTMLRTHGLISA